MDFFSCSVGHVNMLSVVGQPGCDTSEERPACRGSVRVELGHRGKRVWRGAAPGTQRCQSNSVRAALPAEGCRVPGVCHSLEGLWAKRLQLQLAVGVHVPPGVRVHMHVCMLGSSIFVHIDYVIHC